MTTKKLKNIIFLLFLGLVFIPVTTTAQQRSTYKMELIKAVQKTQTDKNNILAFFRVTPLIKKFKLVMSMKVTYGIGKDSITIDVQKQKEDNIQFIIYGKDMAEKDPKLFNLIKDDLKSSITDDEFLIVFNFFNITTMQIDNMTIKYGLWEGRKQDIRNEQTFSFKVNQLE